MIVTTDFLNINGSICFDANWVLFVCFFIFVVTVIAKFFVAGVDLDTNRKMSPTFPYPNVI